MTNRYSDITDREYQNQEAAEDEQDEYEQEVERLKAQVLAAFKSQAKARKAYQAEPFWDDDKIAAFDKFHAAWLTYRSLSDQLNQLIHPEENQV